MADDEDWEQQDKDKLKEWESKLTARFDGDIAKDVIKALKETYESIEDIEQTEEPQEDSTIDEKIEQSCVLDEIINDTKNKYKSDLFKEEVNLADEETKKKIIALWKFFWYTLIKDEPESDLHVTTPDDINWNVNDNEIKEAHDYMNTQCPGGGFLAAQENKNMFTAIAVGQKNNIDLLSLIMDVYELAHIDEIINKRRKFRDQESWAMKCKFFTDQNNTKNANIIRRAIPEFTKRISGGGPADMVVNKIEDDINVYISYVMMMNEVFN